MSWDKNCTRQGPLEAIERKNDNIFSSLYYRKYITSHKGLMSDEQLFDPKQINQSYTIAIIKPNIVLDSQKLK